MMSEIELRRILVVANRTCPCEALLTEVAEHASTSPSEVLIVAPALNKRTKHLASDSDDAVAAAELRLATAVESLSAAGVRATGVVGDAEPGQAIAEVLSSFPADEIIIATHPPGQSHWLERGLLARARREFEGPITHIVSHHGIDGDSQPVAPGAAREPR